MNAPQAEESLRRVQVELHKAKEDAAAAASSTNSASSSLPISSMSKSAAQISRSDEHSKENIANAAPSPLMQRQRNRAAGPGVAAATLASPQMRRLAQELRAAV